MWYTPTAVLPHSPKFPHSSLDHFLFWVPRCPAPSTWESLGVKIDRGGEARVPYKAGPGQQLPMCPSQLLQGAASARNVYLARESGYLPRKGTQGSPPPRPRGLFSRFRAAGVRRGILGKNGGGASNGQRPSGCGASCFLTAYDLGPISAPVSSFDSWDRVTTDTTLERT